MLFHATYISFFIYFRCPNTLALTLHLKVSRTIRPNARRHGQAHSSAKECRSHAAPCHKNGAKQRGGHGTRGTRQLLSYGKKQQYQNSIFVLAMRSISFSICRAPMYLLTGSRAVKGIRRPKLNTSLCFTNMSICFLQNESKQLNLRLESNPSFKPVFVLRSTTGWSSGPEVNSGWTRLVPPTLDRERRVG
jgi:hypothetical protein